MASGFVKAELSTFRHGRPQVTCRLLYKSVLLLGFGLILWKWMNRVDSLGSNQECRIGYKHSHSRVSQCLASIRSLGNRRSSEGLRSFKPSKGTNIKCFRSQNERFSHKAVTSLPTVASSQVSITFKVCNHAIAVYSENKLQHYATAYRNHKSAGEKLGLFRFCTFFTYFFSKYITACSEITFYLNSNTT